MRAILKTILILSLLSIPPLTALENPSEQIIVPLSEPGKPGLLIVDQVKGSISVTGYDGDVVIISAARRTVMTEDTGEKNTVGLKKLSYADVQLSAQQKNNEITVQTNSHKFTVDLVIKVPYTTSLKLNTVDNGKITVHDVTGELEIGNINGDIFLTEISGSAILNTVDGHINIHFKNTLPDMPMAFTTIHGNIDVTLPKEIKALLKMKSNAGSIYSNFDMDMAKRNQIIEKSEKPGAYKVFLEDWKYAKLNGGGAEILFKSFNGNIYIRMRE